MVVGEPYWQKEPTAEHLEAIGEKRSTYGTHYMNVKVGQELGLKLVYTIVSNQDDWDRYEGLQWYANGAVGEGSIQTILIWKKCWSEYGKIKRIT